MGVVEEEKRWKQEAQKASADLITEVSGGRSRAQALETAAESLRREANQLRAGANSESLPFRAITIFSGSCVLSFFFFFLCGHRPRWIALLGRLIEVEQELTEVMQALDQATAGHATLSGIVNLVCDEL
jgi:hypothetical protein